MGRACNRKRRAPWDGEQRWEWGQCRWRRYVVESYSNGWIVGDSGSDVLLFTRVCCCAGQQHHQHQVRYIFYTGRSCCESNWAHTHQTELEGERWADDRRQIDDSINDEITVAGQNVEWCKINALFIKRKRDRVEIVCNKLLTKITQLPSSLNFSTTLAQIPEWLLCVFCGVCSMTPMSVSRHCVLVNFLGVSVMHKLSSSLCTVRLVDQVKYHEHNFWRCAETLWKNQQTNKKLWYDAQKPYSVDCAIARILKRLYESDWQFGKFDSKSLPIEIVSK